MKIRWIIIIVVVLCVLTGCNDMVEIEDRDFILTMGITMEDNEYKVFYIRPDLSTLTGQAAPEGNEYTFVITGESLSKVEEEYGLESDKRLDYSHLKAIILDEKMASNKEKMSEFLAYAEKTYEISRNTLVFLTLDNILDVIQISRSISGSSGEYLDDLYKNNRRGKDALTHSIGDLIDSIHMDDKVAMLPIVEKKEEHLAINGVGIFDDGFYLEKISQEKYMYFDIARGVGKGYKISIPNGKDIEITEIKKSYSFSMRENRPYLLLQVTGRALVDNDGKIISPESVALTNNKITNQLNLYIQKNIINNFKTYTKDKSIDFLNLYRCTALSNRKIWMLYKDNQDKFIEDLLIGVVVDLKLKK